MKRITLTVGLDVDHDTQVADVIHDVTQAIAEHCVTLADELCHTVDGVHVAEQLAPSGWQQWIAAVVGEMRKDAREWRGIDPVNNRTARQLERYADRLEALASEQNAVDALPPAPDAKDAIAAGVRAELEPLADALIAAGHKLAKDGDDAIREPLMVWQRRPDGMVVTVDEKVTLPVRWSHAQPDPIAVAVEDKLRGSR